MKITYFLSFGMYQGASPGVLDGQTVASRVELVCNRQVNESSLKPPLPNIEGPDDDKSINNHGSTKETHTGG